MHTFPEHTAELYSTNCLYRFAQLLQPTLDSDSYLNISHTDSNTKESFSPYSRHLIDIIFLKQELRALNVSQKILDLVPDLQTSQYPELSDINLETLVQPKFNKKMKYDEGEILLTILLVAHGLLPSHYNFSHELQHMLLLRISSVERLIDQKFNSPSHSASPELWSKLHQTPDIFPQHLLKRYRESKKNDMPMRRKGFLSTTVKLLNDGYTFEDEMHAMLGLYGANTARYSQEELRKPFDAALDASRKVLRQKVKDGLGVAHLTHEPNLDTENLAAEVRKFRDQHLAFLFEVLVSLHAPEFKEIHSLSAELETHDRLLGKEVQESEISALTQILQSIYTGVITRESLEIAMSSTSFGRLPYFVKEFYYWLYFLKRAEWKIVSIKDYLAVYKKNQQNPEVATPGHAALQIVYGDSVGKLTEIQFTVDRLRFLSYTEGSHTHYRTQNYRTSHETIQQLEEIVSRALFQPKP